MTAADYTRVDGYPIWTPDDASAEWPTPGGINLALVSPDEMDIRMFQNRAEEYDGWDAASLADLLARQESAARDLLQLQLDAGS